MNGMATAYLVAALIGALVGAVEIFQRYRAEPLQAMWNRWGGVYVLFNSAVAAVAFFVAKESKGLSAESDTIELLRWAKVMAERESMTGTELYDLAGDNAGAEAVARALGVLLKAGLAEVETTATGGRPLSTWRPS